jgi:hypothetical protein
MDEANPAPPDADEPQPWEADPFQRRDAEPHRGNWLRAWSIVALILNVMGVCLLIPWVFGVPLALLLWWAVAHDLRKIRAGEMDPRGEEQTAAARANARVALMIPAVFFLIVGAWLVFRLVSLP